MKFYTIFALVASVAAIRVTTHSETQMKADIKKATDEVLIQMATSILLQKTTEEEWIAWLRKEAATDDGITWSELKDKLKEIAKEHNYEPTEDDWDKMQKLYDSVDTDGNGSVTEAELEAALNAHGH